MLLRARLLLPISRPPIEDGAILVVRGRIRAIGRWRDLAAVPAKEVVDLGERVLLPGLVNAHCHLDYTDMAGGLPPPRVFPDWIKGILALKAHWSFSEYALSWIHGARMLLRSGVTTVADIEAVPELLPHVWHVTPMRVISFLEMTGVKSRRAPRDILREATELVRSLPRPWAKSCGLSPHALYSTTPALLKLCGLLARRRNWRLSAHVAESEPEFDMYQHRRGALFDWLKTQRDMNDCGGISPVAQWARLGLLARHFLAVHVNYPAPGDAALLARKRVSVAHCPRSHAYFRHAPFPRREMATAGVNVCLGTDSLASVVKKQGRPLQLSMFAEMQTLAQAAPDLAPDSILRMATLNGARALGLNGQVGELAPHACADLIGLPFTGRLASAYDHVIHHGGDVALLMIAGQWVSGAKEKAAGAEAKQ